MEGRAKKERKENSVGTNTAGLHTGIHTESQSSCFNMFAVNWLIIWLVEELRPLEWLKLIKLQLLMIVHWKSSVTAVTYAARLLFYCSR